MSASFNRPKGHDRSPWLMSRAALDVVSNMGEAINEMKRAATMLHDYPADAAERIAGRLAARQFIDCCDELERLQGPTVITMDAFRRPQ